MSSKPASARSSAPPGGVSIPLAAAAVLVATLGLTLGALDIRAAWTLRPDGSSLTTGKMPSFDFMNLWAGGKLALAGMLDTLFDEKAYLAWLRATLSPHIGGSEWSYPPTMLLFGAPFSALPLNGAYLVWTLATLAGFAWAMHAAGLRGLPLLLAVLSPAALANVTFGQNGAFTAALLAGGLLLAPQRPWLAGVCFGLLTTKPHLGLLVPFCLLATGNWRAIVSSVLSAAALAGAAALWFGPQVWTLFFERTQPLMTAIMQAPWPQGYQANAVTVFMLMRYLGAGLAAAYAAQAVMAAICAAVAFAIWRSKLASETRTSLTLMLAPLATPYGYTYDMVGFCGALVLLSTRYGAPALWLATFVWLWPSMQRAFVASGVAGPVGALVIAGASIAAVCIAFRAPDGREGQPA